MRYKCYLRIQQRLYQRGGCWYDSQYHEDFSPAPSSVDLELNRDKHAINLLHESVVDLERN